jgi:hypothetical protein
MKRDRRNLALVSVAHLAYVLVSRSRYNIMPFALPFMLVCLYSRKRMQVLKALVLGCAILFLVFFLQQMRYAGSLFNLVRHYSVADLVSRTSQFIRSGSGELGLSRVFYYFVEHDNKFTNFGEGRTYLRLALLPIPSSMLVLKPRDFAMDMWEAWHGVATTTGTMHPTLYGDVFANFGFWGFLMGFPYPLLARVVDIVISRAKTESFKVFYIGIFSTMFVLLARGAVYNSIANAFWGFALLFCIQNATRLRLKTTRVNWDSGMANKNRHCSGLRVFYEQVPAESKEDSGQNHRV